MKKLAIIGLLAVASTVASFAQGNVTFANTDGAAWFGGTVTYAANGVPAGKAGLAVGSGFSAQLYYLNGSSVWTPLSISGVTPTPFFATDGDSANGAGYFVGGVATVPMPIGLVTLQVVAFNTVTIGGYAPGQLTGSSAIFTMNSVALDAPVVPTFEGTGYAGFTVAAVPEPSTFALAGLGLASLLIFRRRK